MNRRGFFAFLPAAIAAAPVAAKAAAAKMGLEGVLGGAIGVGGAWEGQSPGIPSGESWVRRAIAKFASPTVRRERRRQVDWEARRLDSDLASMRSISPAAAHRLQIDRTTRRIEAASWNDLQERLQEEVSAKMGFS